MTVTLCIPDQRRRDLDNLIASTKPLTDGLVDAGVLADDSTQAVESISYRLRFTPGYSGTEYVVELAEGTVGMGL